MQHEKTDTIINPYNMIEEQLNIEEEYKEKILKIWEIYSKLDVLTEFEYRKYPLAPRLVKKNNLLFIGINPSFKKGGEILETEKPIAFYDLNTSSKDKGLAYFEKFKDISTYCKTDWTHLDLFYIRESKQELINKLTYENIPFLEAQLKISFEIIEKSKPKLIVVANALASEFFGKMKSRHFAFDKIWQGHELFFEDNKIPRKKSTFNSSIGTYRINIGGKLTPIIFSSMLSGQRALDIGSLERLKWQIKFVLENKSVNY